MSTWIAAPIATAGVSRIPSNDERARLPRRRRQNVNCPSVAQSFEATRPRLRRQSECAVRRMRWRVTISGGTASEKGAGMSPGERQWSHLDGAADRQDPVALLPGAQPSVAEKPKPHPHTAVAATTAPSATRRRHEPARNGGAANDAGRGSARRIRRMRHRHSVARDGIADVPSRAALVAPPARVGRPAAGHGRRRADTAVLANPPTHHSSVMTGDRRSDAAEPTHPPRIRVES